MTENRKSWTRREFVSQSGRSALALGAGLTSTRAWASVLGANDRIRLGIIGPGGRGRHLIKAAQVIPGVEITAVCDIYEANRQKAIQLAGGRPSLLSIIGNCWIPRRLTGSLLPLQTIGTPP